MAAPGLAGTANDDAGVLVPKLLVFTVNDHPRHVGADRAMAALWAAFTFAPVVHRESRGHVVTFSARIPDVQLEHLPAAVESLRAVDEVQHVALVPLPGTDESPAVLPERGTAAAASGDGDPVGRQP
jgi:hypothetical protein